MSTRTIGWLLGGPSPPQSLPCRNQSCPELRQLDRQQFREDVPYDEFVRQLITAKGSTWQNGAATMFRDSAVGRNHNDREPVISGDSSE